MGQTLFELLTGLNLILYPADDLRQQALSTVAVENPRGWRIAKEKASRKIDAVVALAMASVCAMAHRGEIQSRVARGFNQSVHVAPTIKPTPGPLYIGQMIEPLPVTVVAQTRNGSVSVLAALGGAETSLKNHLQNVVQPWLAKNLPWIFQNRELIIGIFQNIDDQSNVGFAGILQSTLGGSWVQSTKTWEIRRDGMFGFVHQGAAFLDAADPSDKPSRFAAARGSAERPVELREG